MKRHVSTLASLVFSIVATAQVNTSLTSPNGRLTVRINADKQLTYSLVDQGKTLMQDNLADLTFTAGKSGRFVISTKVRTIRESIQAPLYKQARLEDEYTNIRKTIQSVTGKDLARAAKNLLKSGNHITVVMTPED